MKKIFQLVIFIQLSLLGCAQQTFEQELESLYTGSVELVKTDEIPSNAILLDTREWEEYDVSHIPNAIFSGYKDFNTDALKDCLLYTSDAADE